MKDSISKMILLAFVLLAGIGALMLKVMHDALAPVSLLVIPVSGASLKYEGKLSHGPGTMCVQFHTKSGETNTFEDQLHFRMKLSRPDQPILSFSNSLPDANVGGMVFSRSDGKRDPGLRFGVPAGSYEIELECDGVSDVNSIEIYRER